MVFVKCIPDLQKGAFAYMSSSRLVNRFRRRHSTVDKHTISEGSLWGYIIEVLSAAECSPWPSKQALQIAQAI